MQQLIVSIHLTSKIVKSVGKDIQSSGFDKEKFLFELEIFSFGWTIALGP